MVPENPEFEQENHEGPMLLTLVLTSKVLQ